jgi:glycosyltransferase involved in cell wall biosynthesis
VFRREAVSLARADFDVTIIGKDDGTTCPDHQDGVRLVPVRKKPGWVGRLAFLREVRRLALAEPDVDVYHTHDYDQMANAMYIRRKTRRPVVLDVHERYAENYARRLPVIGRIAPKLAERLLEWYENRCAGALHNVIIVYDEEKQRFEDLGCSVLHVDNYATRRDFPADRVTDRQWARRTTIVHTGVLAEVRGSRILVELARALEQSHPHVRVRVVELCHSDRQRQDFYALLNEVGNSSTLELVPVVPANELKRYLDDAIIGMVMLDARGPLRFARPTKPYEHMAMSTPVVATRWGLTERVVEETGAGIVVDGMEPQAYIDAVRRILDDSKLAKQMGEAGRQAFVDRFNWEAVEPQFVEFFRDIVGLESPVNAAEELATR